MAGRLAADRPSAPAAPESEAAGPEAAAAGPEGAGPEGVGPAAVGGSDVPLGPDQLAAERFFRRMMGDGAWDRLSADGKRSRWADGPALAAELRAIRLDESPFDVTSLAVPSVVRARRHLGRETSRHGRMAGRTHPRGRARRDRRRRPRRPPHPSRRICRSGPLRSGPGRPDHWRRHDEGARQRLIRTHRHGPHGPAGVRGPHRDPTGARRPRNRHPGPGRRVGPRRRHHRRRHALEHHGTIDAVVHLAGAGIGDKRWSPARKQTIIESRTRSTRLLVDTVVALSSRPPVLVERVGRRLLRGTGRRGADRGVDAGNRLPRRGVHGLGGGGGSGRGRPASGPSM